MLRSRLYNQLEKNLEYRLRKYSKAEYSTCEDNSQIITVTIKDGIYYLTDGDKEFACRTIDNVIDYIFKRMVTFVKDAKGYWSVQYIHQDRYKPVFMEWCNIKTNKKYKAVAMKHTGFTKEDLC